MLCTVVRPLKNQLHISHYIARDSKEICHKWYEGKQVGKSRGYLDFSLKVLRKPTKLISLAWSRVRFKTSTPEHNYRLTAVQGVSLQVTENKKEYVSNEKIR